MLQCTSTAVCINLQQYCHVKTPMHTVSDDARVFNGLNLSTDSLDFVPFYRHLEKNGLEDDYD